MAVGEVERYFRAAAITIAPADPASPKAQACIHAYFHEVAQRVTEGFDSAHSQTYQQNAKVYKHKITAEITPVKEKLAQISDSQRWLVTSEGAFSYIAHDFGLKELYLWPVNSDQEGTQQQIRKVVDTVKKYQIPPCSVRAPFPINRRTL